MQAAWHYKVAEMAGEENSISPTLSKDLGEAVITGVKERRKLKNESVHAYSLYNDNEVSR